MRIKKSNKSLSCTTTVPSTIDVDLQPNNCYEECCNYIHSAIDALCDCAQNDPKAQEAIANLSIVLFNLQ